MSDIFTDIDTETDACTGTDKKASVSAAINAIIRSLMNSKNSSHPETGKNEAEDVSFTCKNIDAVLGADAHAMDTRPADLINYLMHENLSGKIKCRHCNSSDVVLFGRGRGKQRYMCRECGRTFTGLTNTPLNGTHHPEKWAHYLECMLKSMTLQDSAREIKVSYVTLFYWRHKILSVLKDIKPQAMKGIVELDDIYMNYSKKGQSSSLNFRDFFNSQHRIHRRCDHPYNFDGDKVCVIAAVDRCSDAYSCIACIGHPMGKDIENAVGAMISAANPICFNHKSAYVSFLNKRKLKRCRLSQFNIKLARSYIRKCLVWMDRFMGVATSYLNNYLGWYKFLKDINFNETSAGLKRLMEVACFSEYHPCGKVPELQDECES